MSYESTLVGADSSMHEGVDDVKNKEGAEQAPNKAAEEQKVLTEKKKRNDEYVARLEKLKGQIEVAQAAIAKGGPEASIHAKILPLLENDMEALVASFDDAVEQGTESRQ